MTRAPEQDERIHAEGEPLSAWEQVKQAWREGVDQAKALQERRDVLLRELNALDLHGMSRRINGIEHDLVDLFRRKHALDWGAQEEPDDAIADLMDDWQTAQGELKRRRR